jgi:hypothetical protein
MGMVKLHLQNLAERLFAKRLEVPLVLPSLRRVHEKLGLAESAMFSDVAPIRESSIAISLDRTRGSAGCERSTLRILRRL